jgi:hypothetical protein
LQCCSDKKYDPGASDTEIKIGQTYPLSGPASAFAIRYILATKPDGKIGIIFAK